jgi:hypothetical protein
LTISFAKMGCETDVATAQVTEQATPVYETHKAIHKVHQPLQVGSGKLT